MAQAVSCIALAIVQSPSMAGRGLVVVAVQFSDGSLLALPR